MKKLTISFLGRDCPGIVSAVSQILGQTGCNIIEVTQTILCGEFAAIFIVQNQLFKPLKRLNLVM